MEGFTDEEIDGRDVVYVTEVLPAESEDKLLTGKVSVPFWQILLLVSLTGMNLGMAVAVWVNR